MQEIVVYILIALALAGVFRYAYRKIRTVRENKAGDGCDDCPLQADCGKASKKKKRASCCG